MFSFRSIPGRTTVTNLLNTALLPVGQTLYVYGGGWDYADLGSGPQSTQLGLVPSWLDFFSAQNSAYDYRLFRGQGINPYFYAGLDCSGYLGWVVYNTLRQKNGQSGFVYHSSHFAGMLAKKHGLGILCSNPARLRSGDLFSMDGHVWLCVGRCPDGSMVILHSTPSPSRTGAPGGGVQLSALGSNHCQAALLACDTMRHLAPNWWERYQSMTYPYTTYTTASEPDGGCFLWSSLLSDPHKLRNRSANEVLSLLLS